MTNTEFVEHIIRLYRQAEKSTEEFADPSIHRGRKHTISSMVEDLLAKYICERLADQTLELWIDYAISFKPAGAKSTKTIYPDILIVRPFGHVFKALALIDVKMDLGWKRNLGGTMPAKAKEIKDLQALRLATRKIFDKNGKRVKQDVHISSDIKLSYAVMSDQNMGDASLFQGIKDEVAKCPNELALYTFTTGAYLGYATIDQIQILHAEIERFVSALQVEVAP